MKWPRHFPGLPLHPMLVHYPLAFSAELFSVFDALGLWTNPQPWWTLSLGITAAVGIIGIPIIGMLNPVSGGLIIVFLMPCAANRRLLIHLGNTQVSGSKAPR